MAAPTRFAVPSLSEFETPTELEIEKGSLFQRHKNEKPTEVGAKSDTNLSRNQNADSRERQTGVSTSTGTKESREFIPTSVPIITEHNSNTSKDQASDGSKSSSVSKPGSSCSLIVNPRQRGNPVLKCVRSVPWEYGNIVADYVMGASNCALFLSLRYHQLHPNYIHDRLKALGRSYELRVILVQVDVKEPHHLLKDLAKICLLADCTLILAFSAEEAGRYLETYKVFENKPVESIMEKTEDNYMAKFIDCLTRVKSVNKTDCATLLTAFGSLSNVIEATEDELCLCPGFGPQKAKRLHSMFKEPFIRNSNTSDGQSSRDKDDA